MFLFVKNRSLDTEPWKTAPLVQRLHPFLSRMLRQNADRNSRTSVIEIGFVNQLSLHRDTKFASTSFEFGSKSNANNMDKNIVWNPDSGHSLEVRDFILFAVNNLANSLAVKVAQ